MKEKPMIVPVALSDSDLKSHSGSATSQDTPVYHFKVKDAEVTFYNGVNQYILHAILAEMSLILQKFKTFLSSAATLICAMGSMD